MFLFLLDVKSCIHIRNTTLDTRRVKGVYIFRVHECFIFLRNIKWILFSRNKVVSVWILVPLWEGRASRSGGEEKWEEELAQPAASSSSGQPRGVHPSKLVAGWSSPLQAAERTGQVQGRSKVQIEAPAGQSLAEPHCLLSYCRSVHASQALLQTMKKTKTLTCVLKVPPNVIY